MLLKFTVLTAVLASMAPTAFAADRCMARSGSEVVPLVELYTSEGCSSCPPADRWLSRHYRDGNANFLAFHVDYWDSIGWPDRFGSPRYSQRQRQRVAAQGGSTVYTPQVMVGSDVRTSWRSDSGFAKALAQQEKAPPAGLALRLQPQPGGVNVQLGAAPVAGSSAPAQVWLAQYEDGQVTNVRAGENRGVTLHHDRVVRHVWGPWQLDGKPLSQVQEVKPLDGPWGLVAFVQDADGDTLQSLALPAQACVAGG